MSSILAAIALLTGVAACAGHHAATLAPPASPEAAVREFLAAVKANSLVEMGNLWGSEHGPAATYMHRDELEKRLTVIRIYLEHERYELVQSDEAQIPAPDRRQVLVRLERQGCTPTVPFTLVRWRSGWLISDIDLAAAGNPRRPCTPGGTGG